MLEMKEDILHLFELAKIGNREAFRTLLDLRAMGDEQALIAVAELNRLEAERMDRLFA